MSASLLSRLAVALLVAMGFVVPVEAAQRDEVVQGVPRSEAAVEVARAVAQVQVVELAPATLFPASQRVEVSQRLFVKYRALLI